jgi:hypothetical protein
MNAQDMYAAPARPQPSYPNLVGISGIIPAIFSSPVAILSATYEGNTIAFFSGGHQPLHAASSQGHLLVVRVLLACKSDVNAKSK